MLRVLRSIFSLAAPISIIGLHFLVMLCFINRWDEFVVITLVPIWAWAGLGMFLSLVAWFILKNRISILTFLIWLATGIFCADESPGLLRSFVSAFQKIPSESAPENGGIRLRIVSLNCGKGDKLEAVREVKSLEPDLVFLQEAPADEKELESLTRELFDDRGSFLAHDKVAILGRGILGELRTVPDVLGMAVSFNFAGGQSIDLLNLHLKRAIPRRDLWNPATWKLLTAVRKENRRNLRTLLEEMPEHLLNRPQIVGGDFGTPANDDIYRMLRSNGYIDSFGETGLGWGNTYNAEHPLLRIDQIWSSGRLNPVESRVVENPHSDHRMVVSDFILAKPDGALALR